MQGVDKKSMGLSVVATPTVFEVHRCMNIVCIRGSPGPRSQHSRQGRRRGKEGVCDAS